MSLWTQTDSRFFLGGRTQELDGIQTYTQSAGRWFPQTLGGLRIYSAEDLSVPATSFLRSFDAGTIKPERVMETQYPLMDSGIPIADGYQAPMDKPGDRDDTLNIDGTSLRDKEGRDVGLIDEQGNPVVNPGQIRPGVGAYRNLQSRSIAGVKLDKLTGRWMPEYAYFAPPKKDEPLTDIERLNLKPYQDDAYVPPRKPFPVQQAEEAQRGYFEERAKLEERYKHQKQLLRNRELGMRPITKPFIQKPLPRVPGKLGADRIAALQGEVSRFGIGVVGSAPHTPSPLSHEPTPPTTPVHEPTPPTTSSLTVPTSPAVPSTSGASMLDTLHAFFMGTSKRNEDLSERKVLEVEATGKPLEALDKGVYQPARGGMANADVGATINKNQAHASTIEPSPAIVNALQRTQEMEQKQSTPQSFLSNPLSAQTVPILEDVKTYDELARKIYTNKKSLSLMGDRSEALKLYRYFAQYEPEFLKLAADDRLSIEYPTQSEERLVWDYLNVWVHSLKEEEEEKRKKKKRPN